ncbi:iron-sulfur cluster carrier protein ApbC [Glaciecola sp. SC05]|uniref:iron-sulfur cluster carrier protein ApbC n=1 Tax=Glaciecola sp. SC05 TaxID=1987355 RepID=UPI0035282D3C
MFFRSKKNNPEDPLCKEIARSCNRFFETTNSVHIQVSKNKQGQYNIVLGFVCDTLKEALLADLCEQHAKLSPEALQVSYNVAIFEAKKSPVINVKNIIAVSSGKGGVGKSATAVNLALALKAQGARVGILDADIYGPSVPLMLGTVNASPQSPDNKHMIPISAHGIVSNSIGYLVKNDHASIWRGPMASKALTQLTMETKWPLLDYLIVDMPPGTGDIQLTMAQMLPLTAAVVVTTPQDIALSDAEKGIAMFNKLAVPVLGLVENMSYFECPACHHQTAIFASKGAHRLSDKYSLPILAEVPLDTCIREYADSGKSIFTEAPEHGIASIYLHAAYLLSKQMAQQLKVSPLVQASSIEVTQLN